LETILPGVYPGRARHIHVKAQAPNGPLLTTQLYFPGEPHNARDRLFNPALSLAIQDTADGKAAQFSFILDLS
jgi:protocatechuate 3,4-dioxygenase beta subunit